MSVKPRPGSAGAPVKIDYQFPSWCGKAPPGTHIDVMKEDKLIEKLLIDEKKFYIFGRNADMCDFVAGHASCSRAHAAIMYHKILKKAFIVDLRSAHGSFLGPIRLEAHVPIQLPPDVKIRLGASTRYYVLRDKALGEKEGASAGIDLPEEEDELDNLTEYNTARNKKIAQPTGEDQNLKPIIGRKRKSVKFNNEEDVINPEDVDDSIGKFRNSCEVTIIPTKRQRQGASASKNLISAPVRHSNIPVTFKPHSEVKKTSLYEDVSKVPEITAAPDPDAVAGLPASFFDDPIKAEENSKRSKTYEKEAWPGRGNERNENFGI